MVAAQTRPCLGTRQAGFQCRGSWVFIVVRLSDPRPRCKFDPGPESGSFLFKFPSAAGKSHYSGCQKQQCAGFGDGRALKITAYKSGIVTITIKEFIFIRSRNCWGEDSSRNIFHNIAIIPITGSVIVKSKIEFMTRFSSLPISYWWTPW